MYIIFVCMYVLYIEREIVACSYVVNESTGIGLSDCEPTMCVCVLHVMQIGMIAVLLYMWIVYTCDPYRRR